MWLRTVLPEQYGHQLHVEPTGRPGGHYPRGVAALGDGVVAVISLARDGT